MPKPAGVDGIQGLREFARVVGGRVTMRMHFDPNVGEPLSAELKHRHNSISVLIRASESYFSFDVLVPACCVFSVGRPDRILHAESRLKETLPSIPTIYVRSDRDNSDVSSWFAHAAHRDVVTRLGLRPHEAAHVVENRVVVILLATRHLSHELLQTVLCLAQTVSSGERESRRRKSDEPSLPALLDDLLRRFSEFSVSDDTLREQALDTLGDDKRHALVEQVGPKLPAINAYLDALLEPWPDAALQLSRLAELASELLVERRSGRR